MKTHEEIETHFAKYEIELDGFHTLDVGSVKMVFCGIDDMITEFPEVARSIKKIEYNPGMKYLGTMKSDGLMSISKAGLKDYGTGVHETAHALDFGRSRGFGSTNYSEEIVERARKTLGLRTNSKIYVNMAVRICGSPTEYKKSYELFAYSMETHLGGVKVELSDQIWKLVKGEIV